MVKKGAGKLKIILMVGLPAIMSFKSFVSPFLTRTNDMREENRKLNEAIRQIKADEQAYAGNWQDELTKKEVTASKLLPNAIAAQEVIHYFSTYFAKQNSHVEFGSIVPGAVMATNIPADKENAAIRTRAQKLQIKAKMPSTLVFSYLDHLSKYPSLYHFQELNIFPSNDDKGLKRLQLDIGLEFFLAPKEWLPKNETRVTSTTVSNESTARVVASSPQLSVNWFDTNSVEKLPEEAVPEPTAFPKVKASMPALPVIVGARLVGGNLVLEEVIYELGDKIVGWKIVSIIPQENAVIFQRGEWTRKVVIR